MTVNEMYLARLRTRLARAIVLGDWAAVTMLRARIAKAMTDNPA